MKRNEIEALLDDVKIRCSAAKLKFKDTSDLDDEVNIELSIEMPCGRETRNIYIWDLEDLQLLASTDFQEYSVISGLAAIARYDQGTIDAVISAPLDSRSLFRRQMLFKQLGLTNSQGKRLPLILKPTSKNDTTRVSLQPIPDVLKILSQVPEQPGLGLHISGLSINGHDDASAILERIANSLFFDIDMQKGLHLALTRKTLSRRPPKSISREPIDIEFPRNEYDAAPMALYSYARSAAGMPLLQFLAFYQVIEFYYPVYYNLEIGKRVRSIIKHPTFRADHDLDVMKIVSTIRSKGTGFSSEKDQLKATLKECVPNADIELYLDNDKEAAQALLTKTKGVTNCAVNPANRQTELYGQVADRIYDIRCRIVHTKSEQDDGDFDLLLPYSKEAERLDHDIDLVRFAAQKVIIAASKHLSTAA